MNAMLRATTALGAVVFFAAAVQAQKLYWTDAGTGKLQRANADGSQIEDVLVNTPDAGHGGVALDLNGDWMYLGLGTKIARARLDGSELQILYSFNNPVTTVNGIALDLAAEKIYYSTASCTTGGFSQIGRVDLDGSNLEVLVDYGGACVYLEGLALDVNSGRVYWSDRYYDGIQTTTYRILSAETAGPVMPQSLVEMVSPPGEIYAVTSLALDVDAGKMYWTDHVRIRRANLDGSGAVTLVSLPNVQFRKGLSLDLAAGKMYWSQNGTGPDKGLFRAGLDGSNVEPLFAGSLGYGSLALDAVSGWVYAFHESKSRIRRVSLTDGQIQTLFFGTLSNPLDVAVNVPANQLCVSDLDWGLQCTKLDGSTLEILLNTALPDYSVRGVTFDMDAAKIYWVLTTGALMRSNLDGSGIEVLPANTGIPDRIDLDPTGDKLYWSKLGFPNQIRRANLDGSSDELVTNMAASLAVAGVAVDSAAGKVYWTDTANRKIQRANLDGSGAEDLLTTGLVYPMDIALDSSGNAMYWVDPMVGKVRRARLDGTGVADVVTGLVEPQGIAFSCCRVYGDVFPFTPALGDCQVDVDDLSCVLNDFVISGTCPPADIEPCGGDGDVDVDDILNAISAFTGYYACPHPCP